MAKLNKCAIKKS